MTKNQLLQPPIAQLSVPTGFEQEPSITGNDAELAAYHQSGQSQVATPQSNNSSRSSSLHASPITQSREALQKPRKLIETEQHEVAKDLSMWQLECERAQHLQMLPPFWTEEQRSHYVQTYFLLYHSAPPCWYESATASQYCWYWFPSDTIEQGRKPYVSSWFAAATAVTTAVTVDAFLLAAVSCAPVIVSWPYSSV